MTTEYEVRVLEINEKELIKKIEILGGVKKAEYQQKRYVYDLNPAQKNKWIRLRTNGEYTTLTYKSIINDEIDGTKEIELKVSSFEIANEFLEKIGFKNKAYQENRRIQYELEGVEIDIDTWPMIPTYMEVEGNSKENVLNILSKLEVDETKITTVGVEGIYKHYGINLPKIKKLKFSKKK